MTKRLSLAFENALKREGVTQTEFAQRHGLHGPELSRVKKGKPVNEPTLKAFFSGWKNPGLGWELLQAHLLDECERAGAGSPRLVIEERNADERFLEDLRKMEAFFRRHPDLRSSLQELALVLDKDERSRSETSVREVAEARSGAEAAPVVLTQANPKASYAKKRKR